MPTQTITLYFVHSNQKRYKETCDNILKNGIVFLNPKVRTPDKKINLPVLGGDKHLHFEDQCQQPC